MGHRKGRCHLRDPLAGGWLEHQAWDQKKGYVHTIGTRETSE